MSLPAFVRRAFELNAKDLLDNVRDLTPQELAWQPAPHANSIGFVLWHMTRVEDGWVQRLIQRKVHLYVTDGWAKKMGRAEDMRDMGFNYTAQQLGEFKPPPLDVLIAYHKATRDATYAFLATWNPETPQEVRAPWGGTMTVADVFAQLIWETDAHAGQIAYVRGLQRGLQRPDYMGPLSTPPK